MSFEHPTQEVEELAHHSSEHRESSESNIDEALERIQKMVDHEANTIAESETGISAEAVEKFDERRQEILKRFDAAMQNPSSTHYDRRRVEGRALGGQYEGIDTQI
jgi:hypothetical protein